MRRLKIISATALCFVGSAFVDMPSASAGRLMRDAGIVFSTAVIYRAARNQIRSNSNSSSSYYEDNSSGYDSSPAPESAEEIAAREQAEREHKAALAAQKAAEEERIAQEKRKALTPLSSIGTQSTQATAAAPADCNCTTKSSASPFKSLSDVAEKVDQPIVSHPIDVKFDLSKTNYRVACQNDAGLYQEIGDFKFTLAGATWDSLNSKDTEPSQGHENARRFIKNFKALVRNEVMAIKYPQYPSTVVADLNKISGPQGIEYSDLAGMFETFLVSFGYKSCAIQDQTTKQITYVTPKVLL